MTLELWADAENDGERSCCSAQAVRGARALAHARGLPHLSIDLREEFRAGVVEGWLEGYARGSTPNPCIRCNGSVRLDAMLELATRLGAARLVTGHYARVVSGWPPCRCCGSPPIGSRTRATRSPGSTPPRSRGCAFPLGGLTKPEVREIAEREGLVGRAQARLAGPLLPGGHLAAAVPRAPWRELARRRMVPPTGERQWGRQGVKGGAEGSILDLDGRRLGSHRGAHAFTVGQRHGLGLPGGPEPLFVLRTDPPPTPSPSVPARRSDDPHGRRARRDASPARGARRRGTRPLARAAVSLSAGLRSGAGSARGRRGAAAGADHARRSGTDRLPVRAAT